jgi:hypothetical protein
MDRRIADLDGVIDEVAQAMTRAELPRDLRPAIAARLVAGRLVVAVVAERVARRRGRSRRGGGVLWS